MGSKRPFFSQETPAKEKSPPLKRRVMKVPPPALVAHMKFPRITLPILSALGAIFLGLDAFILPGSLPHLIGLALVFSAAGFLAIHRRMRSPIQRGLIWRSFLILWFLLVLLLLLTQLQQPLEKLLVALLLIPGLALLALSLLVWLRYREFERATGLMKRLRRS